MTWNGVIKTLKYVLNVCHFKLYGIENEARSVDKE